MDPLELRLRNSNQPRRRPPPAAPRSAAARMTECMEAAAEAHRAGSKKRGKSERRLRGVGLANMVHTGGGGRFYGFNSAEAFIKLSDEGTVTLITSALDMGQGAHTAMAQIAAEELGRASERHQRALPRHRAHALRPGVLGEPGELHERQRRPRGGPGREARRWSTAAAEMLEADPDDILVEESKVWVKGSDGEARPLRDRRSRGQRSTARRSRARASSSTQLPEGYTIPTAFAKNIPCFSFGTQAAEVEVDPETGQVHGAQGGRRPRDRDHHQPDHGRGTDRGQRRAGYRLRAHGAPRPRRDGTHRQRPVPRLQDPQHRRHARDQGDTASRARARTARSAPRASASPDWCPPLRRSPTRSTTRSASASTSCPSPASRSSRR